MDAFMNMIKTATSGVLGSLSSLGDVDPNATSQMELEQESMVGYDNPELQLSLPNIVEDRGDYNPNPYNFPQASLDESARTQEIVNPDGLGVLPVMAENFAEAAPQVFDEVTPLPTDDPMGTLANERESMIGYGFAPEETEVKPPPTDVNDKQGIKEYQESLILPKAQAMGDKAKQLYINDHENRSVDQERTFFGMVADAANVIGKPLKMGFDAWMKLSPSTRMALVGTAATAYAYQRGWSNTAGKAALVTANMYSDAQGREATIQGETDIANMQARNEAQTKQLASAMKAQYPEADMQEHDFKRIDSDLDAFLNEKYSSLFGDDEIGLAKHRMVLRNKYLNHIRSNKANAAVYSLTQFLEDEVKAEEIRKAQEKAAKGE